MIVVRLKGGLGNQLFQYALGRRLTYFNNAQLKLDDSFYRTQNSRTRTYGLRHFKVVENIATDEDLDAFGARERGGIRGILGRVLDRKKPLQMGAQIEEKSFRFDPEVLKTPDNSYLDGYWQTEKYFHEIADIIRVELTPRQRMDDTNAHMASEIAGANSVSIHIRRGDYVTNPAANRYHGTCPLDYYRRCIDEISQMVHNPHFYVFSDDFHWAKTNLHIESPVAYVGHNSQVDDFKDLYLMSKCKHHIIANSTFSWWGAWLARDKDKIVFIKV